MYNTCVFVACQGIECVLNVKACLFCFLVCMFIVVVLIALKM